MVMHGRKLCGGYMLLRAAGSCTMAVAVAAVTASATIVGWGDAWETCVVGTGGVPAPADLVCGSAECCAAMLPAAAHCDELSPTDWCKGDLGSCHVGSAAGLLTEATALATAGEEVGEGSSEAVQGRLGEGWTADLGSPPLPLSPPAFSKTSVWVRLRGAVRPPVADNATLTADLQALGLGGSARGVCAPIMTLPLGFRPTRTHRFLVTTASGDAEAVTTQGPGVETSTRAVLQVTADGSVAVVASAGPHPHAGANFSSISLDSIRFTWFFTDINGAAADTSQGRFSPLPLAQAFEDTGPTGVASRAPSAWLESDTGVLHLRGAAVLRSGQVCEAEGRCEIFSLTGDAAAAIVPTGTDEEVVRLPQWSEAAVAVAAASNNEGGGRDDHYGQRTVSWVEISYDVANETLVGILVNGTAGDVVSLDGVALLPTSIEVARSKPAVQSSTGGGGDASRANDGGFQTTFADGTCSGTNTSTTAAIDDDGYFTGEYATEIPWWRVDLKASSRVRFVTITNRGDCCGHHLDGMQVRVGDKLFNNGNSNGECAGIPNTGRANAVKQAETESFECPDGGLVGRYVNIRLPDRDFALVLCEVGVFGLEVTDGSGAALHEIRLLRDEFFGGWEVMVANSTARALTVGGGGAGEVCLAGTVGFSPWWTSFNGQPLGVLDQAWRPTFRTKQPVACLVAGVVAECAMTIEVNGTLWVTDGRVDPAPAAGEGNWVGLDGVCFGSGAYRATVDLEGSSRLDVFGSSTLGGA